MIHFDDTRRAALSDALEHRHPHTNDVTAYINSDYSKTKPHQSNGYAFFAVINALYAVKARVKGGWA